MGVNESAFCRTADEVYCDIYQNLKHLVKMYLDVMEKLKN